MRRVVFACHTVYQIFIAYIIKLTEYEKDECILLVEGKNNVGDVVTKSEELGVWANVYFYNRSGESDKDILDWLKNRKLNLVDIEHIGAWGGRVANLLSTILSDDAYIIINEEGTASYSWLSGYNFWNDRYWRGTAEKSLRLDKIRYSMLFDARISNNQLDITEKDICLDAFVDLMKKGWMERLNKVFGYKESNIEHQYVFFDQNLCGQKVAGDDYQNYIIGCCAGCITPNSLIYKPHPSESKKDKLHSIENIVTDMDNHLVPWEIIFLNKLLKKNSLKDQLYFTYCSSAAINSVLIGRIFNLDVRIILLYKIVNRYSCNKILLDEGVIDRYIHYYGKDRILVPNTIDELLGMFGLQDKANIPCEEKWFANFYFRNFLNIPACDYFQEEQIENLPVDSRVVLYGAGNFGQTIYKKLIEKNNIIICWVDKNYKNIKNLMNEIKDPQSIKDEKFDYIYIAVKSNLVRNEIKKELEENGVRMGIVREPKK